MEKSFNLKVGQVVNFYNYSDHAKKYPVEGRVLGIQQANEDDREWDLLHWIWFLNNDGDVCVACHELDGTIGIDYTWKDLADFDTHPYAASLNAAGYELSREKGYWEVIKK